MKSLSPDQIRSLAGMAGFEVGPEEMDDFETLTQFVLAQLEAFDTLINPPLSIVPAKRDYDEISQTRPSPDDPYNAIIRRCDVAGDDAGILTGKRIGLKDLISVAGLPMTCASRILVNFVPQEDATVTARILREGGRITALLNLEDLAFSGGGETSAFGTVLNPFDRMRTASGSSGGSAAALYYDDIDITFGTDQGGSIRLPAAWCGVLGLKPTHGLVPYTGIAGIDHTIDHVGPLAQTVTDLALGLQAVAGRDGLDPRQPGQVDTQDYSAAVAGAPDSLDGFRVGVINEALGEEGPPGTAETVQATRESLGVLGQLGATVEDISLPEHALGAMLFPVIVFGGGAATFRSFGQAYHQTGRYDLAMTQAFADGLTQRANELPPTVKLVTLIGAYLHREYGGTIYGLAQNLRPQIAAGFDAALRTYDLLLTSTATHYAHCALPEASVSEKVMRGYGMVSNCAPTNFTGHPALSMPLAEADGLPVGVQIIGPRFGEAKMLAFAQVLEREHGWRPGIRAR